MTAGAADLLAFATAALMRLGVPEEAAAVTAACLVEADLEGNGSHGLMRLPAWCSRVRNGAVDPRAPMVVVEDRGALATIDAGNGLGPVAGKLAMAEAVERAGRFGIGAVGVRRSSHLGALSFYVRPPATEGVIALAMSNTPSAMAAPGALRTFLGTNPIAVGLPTAGEPIVIDLATSQVARGRIMQAVRAGVPIPEGWARDAAGEPTTDATAGLAGFLEPLGGAKGFALALMVEALAAVLPGAAVGPDVVSSYGGFDRPAGTGHFFLAIAPDAGFADRMDAVADGIRATGPGVRLPGERRTALRRAGRVTLPPEVIADLGVLAAEVGLSAPA